MFDIKYKELEEKHKENLEEMLKELLDETEELIESCIENYDKDIAREVEENRRLANKINKIVNIGELTKEAKQLNNINKYRYMG